MNFLIALYVIIVDGNIKRGFNMMQKIGIELVESLNVIIEHLYDNWQKDKANESFIQLYRTVKTLRPNHDVTYYSNLLKAYAKQDYEKYQELLNG